MTESYPLMKVAGTSIESRLFARFVSLDPLKTPALKANGPGLFGVSAYVTEAVAPFAREGIFAMTPPAIAEPVPFGLVIETSIVLGGSVAVKATFVAVFGPALEIANVHA